MTARAWPLLLLAVATCSCFDRDRVNKNCAWTNDTAFPLDLQNPAHQQHLIYDGQLAEDLAIRFADAEHKRLFGSEAHGGLIEGGRLRERCMARLVDVIEQSHAVTAEQVLYASGQRNRTSDLAVLLSFILLFSVGATAIYRWVHGRLSDEERWVHVAAIVALSCAVSTGGIVSFQLWGSIWEVVRVGNGHMSSFRAARSPWVQYFRELFAGGVVLFWLIALTCDRTMSHDEDARPDVGRPDGIRLR